MNVVFFFVYCLISFKKLVGLKFSPPPRAKWWNYKKHPAGTKHANWLKKIFAFNRKIYSLTSFFKILAYFGTVKV